MKIANLPPQFVARPSRSVSRERPGMTGFTLIELMITVAIIGILAAIAYPAYTSSIIKGKRGEGRSALVDLMQQQERYLTQTGSYGYNSDVIAPGATGVPFKLYSGNSAAGTAYNLGVRKCTFSPVPALSDCAEMYAVPTFTDTQAGTLWVRSTGERGCSVTGSSVCWK